MAGCWRKLRRLVGSFVTLHIAKCHKCDQVKKNYLDGTCGSYVGEERCAQVLSGKVKKSNHLEDIRVDVRMILK